MALLQNGAVHLFWQTEVLEKWTSDLVQLGYAVHHANCSDKPTLQIDMSAILLWQDQFGYPSWNGNLDAFNDGMRYFPFGPYCRAALILRRFDLLFRTDPRTAEAILDIIEYQARNHLLEGNRLLALVQTDDPTLSLPALGGRAAVWNPQEMSFTARGIQA